MIIRSKNFVLKLEEILKDELPTERYNEHEKIVLNIIRKWYSNAQFFTHQTSGSTGRPKKIDISREKIEISTGATMASIDPNGRIKSSLLCLDPSFIGGAMVVYRSLVCNHDLTIVEPSKDLKEVLSKDTFDLVSIVPLQFESLTPSELNSFGTILIGGASMNVQEVSTQSNVYSTFGMTETVSHFALRRLDEEFFTTTGDTEVASTAEGVLQIRGTITDHKWLTTNDIVKINSSRLFKWIGRKDFIINSGGVKINPEAVEQQLRSVTSGDFMIGWLPDPSLGQKVIFLSSIDEHPIDFSRLDRFHRPKSLYFNQQIFKTSTGKVDRLKTLENLRKTL